MAWLRTEEGGVVHASSGLTFCFEPSIPREVPDYLVREFKSKGLQEVGNESPKKVTISKNTKSDELDSVLLGLIRKGNPTDFKTDRTPKFLVVNAMLTEKRSAREIARRFAEILNSGSIQSSSSF